MARGIYLTDHISAKEAHIHFKLAEHTNKICGNLRLTNDWYAQIYDSCLWLSHIYISIYHHHTVQVPICALVNALVLWGKTPPAQVAIRSTRARFALRWCPCASGIWLLHPAPRDLCPRWSWHCATCTGGVFPQSTNAYTNAHIATCTVWWWWCLWLHFLCSGDCIYAVVVAVHGGFAAVNITEDSSWRTFLTRVYTVLRTDSRCLMYCARIQLLSLVRPGVSDNVTNNTLVQHLPEHLYTPCLLSSCVRPVSSN